MILFDGAAAKLAVSLSVFMIAHAFEPYVTTKAKGTGLGLAIVKKIIDEHRGRVVLENTPPRGARVTLVFAVLPSAAAAA